MPSKIEKAWLIRGSTENERDPETGEMLWWSNDGGWGSLGEAVVFTDQEQKTNRLPKGGRWVCFTSDPIDAEDSHEAEELAILQRIGDQIQALTGWHVGTFAEGIARAMIDGADDDLTDQRLFDECAEDDLTSIRSREGGERFHLVEAAIRELALALYRQHKNSPK